MEELDTDDLLEESQIVPVVASVLPPPVAPPRAHRLTPAPRRLPRERGMAPWVVGGVAIGALFSLGVAVIVRVVDARTPYPRTSITVVEAQRGNASPSPASSAVSPAAAGIPVVTVDALPMVAATRGTLRFASQSHGHRVFVDGVVVGESDAPLDVRCGKRSIRVGSRAEEQLVDVPCGGVVDVR